MWAWISNLLQLFVLASFCRNTISRRWCIMCAWVTFEGHQTWIESKAWKKSYTVCIAAFCCCSAEWSFAASSLIFLSRTSLSANKTRTLLSACKTSLTCCSRYKKVTIKEHKVEKTRDHIYLALHFLKEQAMPKNDFFDALRAAPAPERALCRFAKPTTGNIDPPFAHQFFLLALGIVWVRIACWACMRFLTGSCTCASWRSHTGQLWCCRRFVSCRCFQPFRTFGPITHCNSRLFLNNRWTFQ